MFRELVKMSMQNCFIVENCTLDACAQIIHREKGTFTLPVIGHFLFPVMRDQKKYFPCYVIAEFHVTRD